MDEKGGLDIGGSQECPEVDSTLEQKPGSCLHARRNSSMRQMCREVQGVY